MKGRSAGWSLAIASRRASDSVGVLLFSMTAGTVATDRLPGCAIRQSLRSVKLSVFGVVDSAQAVKMPAVLRPYRGFDRLVGRIVVLWCGVDEVFFPGFTRRLGVDLNAVNV